MVIMNEFNTGVAEKFLQQSGSDFGTKRQERKKESCFFCINSTVQILMFFCHIINTICEYVSLVR